MKYARRSVKEKDIIHYEAFKTNLKQIRGMGDFKFPDEAGAAGAGAAAEVGGAAPDDDDDDADSLYD